jgi:hypothetical protein
MGSQACPQWCRLTGHWCAGNLEIGYLTDGIQPGDSQDYVTGTCPICLVAHEREVYPALVQPDGGGGHAGGKRLREQHHPRVDELVGEQANVGMGL